MLNHQGYRKILNKMESKEPKQKQTWFRHSFLESNERRLLWKKEKIYERKRMKHDLIDKTFILKQIKQTTEKKSFTTKMEKMKNLI